MTQRGNCMIRLIFMKPLLWNWQGGDIKCGYFFFGSKSGRKNILQFSHICAFSFTFRSSHSRWDRNYTLSTAQIPDIPVI